MALRMAPRPASSAAAPTQTQTNTTGPEQDDRQSAQIGVLRLRGEPRPRPGVRWADDVVDNSQMNKKKSKVCCIYHKPREVGESSSESSSSSSDSDSDSDQDNSTARMGGKGASKRGIRDNKGHECDGHDHQHDQAEDSSASDSDSSDSNSRSAPRGLPSQRNGGRSARRRSPNAYEKMKTYSTAAAASGAINGAPPL